MAGFNFGTTAQPVNSQSYLRAWKIYDNVEFDGISGPQEGTSSNGNKWRKWEFTFKCKEGIYKESIFEPSATDVDRVEVETSNGGKRMLPSRVETLNLIIQQIVFVYMNDKNKAKFQQLAESGKFNNIELNKFIDILKKLLENPKKPSENYPIQLKLQGRNNDGKVYAKLPNAAISTKDNSAWMERFLGSNLTMTPYEVQQAKATTESKPTDMNSIDTPVQNTEDLDELTKELDNII